ncbi:hypothetical protein IW261DRAFT_300349 [Armillaria novae-zelandiae]|uniref:Uncharacterized protein n=1 Tax=Armillaria novae-zelandiae TaxID=153914 RepID=A0AA39P4J1_9AGAR|nr:hypothetical protein IW261DRAFT_300349 [Armillaria novae-zelandiae]
MNQRHPQLLSHQPSTTIWAKMPDKGKKRSAPSDDAGEEDKGQCSKRLRTIATLPSIGKPSRLRSLGSPKARPRNRPRANANARRPTIALNPSTPLQIIPSESPYKLGSFDFWPITHKSLGRAAGNSVLPDYESIFNVLSRWQIQGIMDGGIRCFIPDLPNVESGEEKGRMWCFGIMSQEIDELAISSLALTDAFECDIANFPQHRDGETVESVVGNTFTPMTGIVSASRGVFKMNCSPVWTEVHNGGENNGLGIELCEVFEGYLEMAVKYDPSVAQEYGSGHGYKFRSGLWGIRSRCRDFMLKYD